MIYPTKLMRSLLMALAILFVAPFTGVDAGLVGVQAAQAQTVRTVVVEGNSRVDDATVVSYLTVRPGQAATSSAINSSIEALYGTGLFSTVNVNLSGSTLVVRVSENPIVASVLFEGNQRFSDAQLLTMVNVGNRGTYTQEGVAQDVESIRLAYDQQGFTGVAVSSRTEALENGRLRVVFVVNEGQRAGIAAINFTGNNTFGAGTLKSVILTKETGLLSFLFRDDTYDQAKLEVDRDLIRRYYANHGFPDAQVTSAVAEYDAQRNAYFVNYTIVEGDRYDFGGMGIETSIAGLDTEALRWSIRSREGSSYNQSQVTRTSEDLALQATSQGYPFADVRPRVDRDIANRRFNITYLVDEGSRIYVERINITGNDKTRDFVIRRELDFAEGDPFNRSMVTRGKTAIEGLGFFSAVNISSSAGSAPDKVVINIAVVEQSTGDYGLTAGYSTQDGVLGEVSLTERNFLGRGQYLRVAVGATANGQTYDFSFTEPRFMGLKVSAGIDLYHRINDETSTTYYGSTTTGGQLRFGLPIASNLNASLFAGIETKQLTDEEEPFSVIVDGTENRNKYTLGYTLTYNTLDNSRRPREGLLATFTQSYAGWDNNYIKSEFRGRYFQTLIEDWSVIGSVRATAGVINELSDGGLHGTEGFYKSSDLVRGFAPRGFGPRADFNNESLASTAYAGLSAEVEFPIPVLPESYGLRGAVWADVGWVDGVAGDLEAGGVKETSLDTDIRAAIGASVIWDSPFGPLRGDFGHVLSKATDDKTQVFQLTLSTLL